MTDMLYESRMLALGCCARANPFTMPRRLSGNENEMAAAMILIGLVADGLAISEIDTERDEIGYRVTKAGRAALSDARLSRGGDDE